MTRILLSGTLLLMLGCAMPPERVPLRPLPENGQVLPYAELLTRVRAQANKANDAFFLDRWDDLEDMAKGIEQTSRFLSKAEEVPERNRKTLKEVTDDLVQSAKKLRDASAAHNIKDTTDALQKINARVRDLRLTNESGEQPKKE
jgi:predicted  nucleic acid-binding Zn-ribbon protein